MNPAQKQFFLEPRSVEKAISYQLAEDVMVIAPPSERMSGMTRCDFCDDAQTVESWDVAVRDQPDDNNLLLKAPRRST